MSDHEHTEPEPDERSDARATEAEEPQGEPEDPQREGDDMPIHDA